MARVCGPSLCWDLFSMGKSVLLAANKNSLQFGSAIDNLGGQQCVRESTQSGRQDGARGKPSCSKFLIIQMSPPCGRKRSKCTHLPSGDHTGESMRLSPS